MNLRHVAFLVSLVVGCLSAQEAAGTKKPVDRVIGAVTAVERTAHRVTVKDDKTITEYTVDLQNAKTLLKVQPGAKDLTGATRITADDLEIGDRVQVAGSKDEAGSNAIVARSVILMSGRELQQAHEAEAAAWQHSIPGVVTAVDSASGKINVNMRTANGMQPAIVDASKAQLTRYSPESPKSPVRSQLGDIQPSDHLLVIGEKSSDGALIAATKIYSGAFRTINGSVVSVSPDGKLLTIRNLATKQPVLVSLSEQSAIRRLPPMLAMGLARRLNPAGDAPVQSGGPSSPMRRGNGDISQLIERVPKVNVTDLKPGDAVVIAGVATGTDSSRLAATNVIAGVEPILQSAPRRQGAEVLGGDWGLGDIAVPQ
jgi:hypothetical protein